MNEYDSPNYHEYSYDKKGEGRLLLGRILLIILYVAFSVGYFLFCTTTKILPIFALWPIFLWMLVFFTWRLVSYDCYFEFRSGMLEVGRVKVKKSGRRKSPRLSVQVKTAEYIAPLAESQEMLSSLGRVYDYSSSCASPHRILIVFDKDGARSGLIIEGTARLATLLASFCPNTHNIKGQTFHG